MENYPVKEVEWIASNFSSGRLLIDFNNGSYALWKLYPRFKISMDGRYEEVYPESTNLLVAQALNGRGNEQVEAVKKINPTLVLTDKTNKERWRNSLPEWQVKFIGEKYMVLGL